MFTNIESLESRRLMSGVGEVALAEDHAPAATSSHPGGVNVVLADGSVRFLKSTVSLSDTFATTSFVDNWRVQR